MKPMIRVDNLSKRYRLGARQAPYGTLRDTLAGAVRAPLRRLRQGGRTATETLWALKDVNFEVQPGEVVGIIGRNGAGKSTLLKVLSRITEPTAGRVELYGRVGSLLEVGTGFHPELTGRENIYLNGAILGMRRAEIARKFDEIVAFAEIERFLDTPVKHYSSGMYMRLAFAVAANLEPEILIVDEVLAVGDAAFQKKCLGKMGSVAREGRTVLFVSHNTGAVASLCGRCLLLDKGTVMRDGGVTEVTALYQESLYAMAADTADLRDVERYGKGNARFTSVALTYLDQSGVGQPFLRAGHTLRVDVVIVASVRTTSANVALIIYDAMGYRLIDANTALQGSFVSLEAGQEARVCFELRDVLLKPGLYLLGLWLGRGAIEDIDGITYATSFTVEPDPEATVHTETFPGVYQCRYSQRIDLGQA